MKDVRSLCWFGVPAGRVLVAVVIGAVAVAAVLTLAVMAALAAEPTPQHATGDAAAPPSPPAPAQVDPHAGHQHPSKAPETVPGEPPSPAGGAAVLDIVFDTVSDERAISAEPNAPFEFQVVARHAQGGVAGWEARVVIDKRIAVLERAAEGLNMAPGEDNWQVGLGGHCLEGAEVVLARYKAIVWVKDATDLVLGLAPIARSSFTPASPGYLTCLTEGDIRPLATADTLAVVNPERVRPRAPGQKPGAADRFQPVRDRH